MLSEVSNAWNTTANDPDPSYLRTSYLFFNVFPINYFLGIGPDFDVNNIKRVSLRKIKDSN